MTDGESSERISKILGLNCPERGHWEGELELRNPAGGKVGEKGKDTPALSKLYPVGGRAAKGRSLERTGSSETRKESRQSAPRS